MGLVGPTYLCTIYNKTRVLHSAKHFYPQANDVKNHDLGVFT